MAASIKATNSVTLSNLSGFSNSVDVLKKVLENVPEGARYDLSVTKDDRFGSNSFTIKFAWDAPIET